MKIRLVLLSCLLTVAAIAADVDGKWTAEVQGRNGETMTAVFNLKADGTTLTGTVSSGRMGDAEISNGKIDGDNISFDVVREFNGNSFTRHYKGTVSGDTLKLKVEANRGPSREITAKRSTT
ncbi:MAG: hypothetical protein JO061_03765 [Acidobacteriaceae bacterium]|nr:hypothetical protein [Acidobacteriaceae bacterium]